MSERRWGALDLFVIAGALALGLALFVLLPRELPRLDPATASWMTYEHEALGFSCELPREYRAETDEDGVRFRFEGAPLVSISLTTRERAADRGLWGEHDPVGETELGGRPGALYRYEHYDGPFGMPVVSYVVPYRGRFLAVEFRNTGLDAVDRRVLGSFRFREE